VWDEDEVFVMAQAKQTVFREVEVMAAPGYTPGLRPVRHQRTPEPNAYARFSQKRTAVNEAYFFREERASGLQSTDLSTTEKIEARIGGLDHVVNFSEYYIFPTMEETIREIIPLLQHRKVNKQEVVKLYLQDIDRTGYNEPVFIIDGIMTNHSGYFLSLAPTDVLRVGLINTQVKMDYFGVIGSSGIVVVETRIPGHSKSILRGNNILKVKGLNRAVSFPQKLQEHSGRERIPDLRSTLFWASHLSTNESGNLPVTFSTSDDSGRYTMVIEGITNDGRPFFHQLEFEVRYNPD
jgi:hypothetical protein